MMGYIYVRYGSMLYRCNVLTVRNTTKSTVIDFFLSQMAHVRIARITTNEKYNQYVHRIKGDGMPRVRRLDKIRLGKRVRRNVVQPE